MENKVKVDIALYYGNMIWGIDHRKRSLKAPDQEYKYGHYYYVMYDDKHIIDAVEKA